MLMPLLLFAVVACSPTNLSRISPSIIPRKIMILFYGLFMLLMSAISLSVLGILQIAVLVDYRPATLISVVLVIALLQWRSSKIQGILLRRRMHSHQLRQRMNHSKQRLEEQQRLISLLTHEVKTPLSVLRLATSMSAQSEPLQRHTEKAVLEITALVDRFSRFLRQEGETAIKIDLTSFDLHEELLAIRAQKRATRMKFTGANLPAFTTDKALFSIIAGNLMENAMKYGDPQKPMQIRAAAQQQRGAPGIAIEFTNAPGSAGFPDPAKLFDQFYRAPRAETQNGAGLGLYIVQGICKTLGGTIEYLPSPRRIRFRIWLPDLA